MIGLVGVPHGDLPTDELFWSNKGVRGGPAPVRAYLPHLLDLVWRRQVDPGKVFDLTSRCRRLPRPIGPWTSDAPSRCSSSPELRQLRHAAERDGSTPARPGRQTGPATSGVAARRLQADGAAVRVEARQAGRPAAR